MVENTVTEVTDEFPKWITSFDCNTERHRSCRYQNKGDYRCKCNCHNDYTFKEHLRVFYPEEYARRFNAQPD